MIVVDGSLRAGRAAFNDGQADNSIAAERLHVPHLVDLEIASGPRRLSAADVAGAVRRTAGLQTWRRLRWLSGGGLSAYLGCANLSAYTPAKCGLGGSPEPCAARHSGSAQRHRAKPSVRITVVPR